MSFGACAGEFTRVDTMVAIRSSVALAPVTTQAPAQPGRLRCAARPRTVRHAPAYLVAYDVSDHRERRHVARVLESFGIRSQKSVFTCRLTRGWLAAMNERLRDLGLKTGNVLIAPIDQRRVATMLGAAPATAPLPSRTAAIIV